MIELAKAHGNEYVEYLRAMPKYLKNCSSYRELGTYQGGSASVALSMNLGYYEFIDKSFSNYNRIKKVLDEHVISNNLEVVFHELSSLKVSTTKETDFLLIDSVHEYAHVAKELETFAHLTKKYIMLHDTAGFPEVYSAVKDFLSRSTDWTEVEHYTVNAGYTVLETALQ